MLPSPASAGLSNIKQDSHCQVDTAKEDPKPTPTSCQGPVAWGAHVPHMNIPQLLFLTASVRPLPSVQPHFQYPALRIIFKYSASQEIR